MSAPIHDPIGIKFVGLTHWSICNNKYMHLSVVKYHFPFGPRLRLPRCFDTSMLYDGTEAALGRAWRAAGIARSELFIKTKLLTWDDDDEHLATHIIYNRPSVRDFN